MRELFVGYKMNDPYGEGSPMKGICSRGDLKTDNPSASGCTDTKVLNGWMDGWMNGQSQDNLILHR